MSEWWRDIKVVDGDGHVASTEETWERYLPEPYVNRRPRIIQDNTGADRWLVEGQLYPKPEGLCSGQPEGIKGSMLHEGVVSPERRLEDMDLEGIEVGVMFGNLPELLLSALYDKDLATAMSRAWNDFLVDFCETDPRRLKGVALLAMQDVPSAVEELRRSTQELGHPTVMLPTNVGKRDLDHPDFLPVFEEAAKLDVPLCVHAAPSANAFAGDDRFDNFFYTHCVAHPFEQMIAMMCIIGGGILERFPDLRIAFLESGVGWVPYWINRLDAHYEKRANLLPWLPRPPGEYVERGNVYFFCESDEDQLPMLANAMPDRIVFTSDYPHWDAVFPGAVGTLAERTDLTQEQKHKILSTNGLRFFGFES